jgi:hypothetical protein
MPRGTRIGAVPPVSVVTLGRESWKLRAACAADPEVFDREAWSADALERARAICRACPVASECADLAAAAQPHWGVWAGVEWIATGRQETGSPVVGGLDA